MHMMMTTDLHNEQCEWFLAIMSFSHISPPALDFCVGFLFQIHACWGTHDVTNYRRQFAFTMWWFLKRYCLDVGLVFVVFVYIQHFTHMNTHTLTLALFTECDLNASHLPTTLTTKSSYITEIICYKIKFSSESYVQLAFWVSVCELLLFLVCVFFLFLFLFCVKINRERKETFNFHMVLFYCDSFVVHSQNNTHSLAQPHTQNGNYFWLNRLLFRRGRKTNAKYRANTPNMKWEPKR